MTRIRPPAVVDVLVLPGSLRATAVTTRIATVATTAAVPGVTAVLADGLDVIPLYNHDLDTGTPPEPVAALRRRAAAADALLVVSPAHNGSVSAALKNALDWLSRPRGIAPLQGKPVALLVAGYAVTSAEAHLDHILAMAGAQVVASRGRAVSLKQLDGREPGEAPAVQHAVISALSALRLTVAEGAETV